MLINKEDTVLLAVDFQEKLMPAIKMNEELEAKAIKLIKGFKILDLPIMVSQQYTKGLGETIPNIKNVIGDFKHIEKTSFSCCGVAEFVEELNKLNKKNIVVIGIEAHICVMQTALELLEKEYNVIVVADCVGSRSNNDKKYAVRRMSENGAIVTTYESLLFELCKNAKAEGFREISKLIK